MIYTYVAAALISASVAATGAWQVQNWRWSANTAKQAKEFDVERESWNLKVLAAEKAGRAQLDANRANANAANAQHSADLLKLNVNLKGAQREINRLSDNLAACKLVPDLVRLLNDQRATVDASHGRD